ncbi:S1 family peptidase [Amycolatopsis anabasis]|uniref:S1 family peptidase n=1 Tax=Amycolatopsis anabasis TaxID=1840409 RepID=UPI00131AFDE3|nr:S1 family peptidase [Amycolatopsis anabasis]
MKLLRRLLLPCLLLPLLTPATAHAAPAPLGGGSPLSTPTSYRCVASFAATGNKTGYLITSPRCGRPGETVHSNRVLVGVVAAAPIPPVNASVVRVTNTTDWKLVGRIPPGNPRITGSTEAPVGASVCMLGPVSGWHCGTIQAKNQTVNFPEGTLHGLTRTTVCAEPGDAGAPFFSGEQAQGVLVGGSGNCASGGTSYFQPINKILAVYGLTLLTG